MPHDTPTALSLLREGNARFAAGESAGHFCLKARAAGVEGQQPWAAVVGCSDSRVPVEAVFDAGPGELFVVRTAGHVLAQASLASLRFAVEILGVPTVVVLGHENCGAVSAALQGDSPAWLDPIVRHIRIEGLDLSSAVEEHARDTVVELDAFFRAAELPAGPPTVVGATFALASGMVHWLD